MKRTRAPSKAAPTTSPEAPELAVALAPSWGNAEVAAQLASAPMPEATSALAQFASSTDQATALDLYAAVAEETPATQAPASAAPAAAAAPVDMDLYGSAVDKPAPAAAAMAPVDMDLYGPAVDKPAPAAAAMAPVDMDLYGSAVDKPTPAAAAMAPVDTDLYGSAVDKPTPASAPPAAAMAPAPAPAPAKRDPNWSLGQAPAPARRDPRYASEFTNYHERSVARMFNPDAKRASGFNAADGEEMTHLRTRQFKPAELEARTASSSFGQMTRADGSLHDSTGSRAAFEKKGSNDGPDVEMWALTEDDTLRTSNQSADMNGSEELMESGALRKRGQDKSAFSPPANVAAARSMGVPENLELPHHSSVGDGKDVKGAGMMRTKEGRVEHISNSSGHYQPTPENLFHSIDVLDSKGMGVSHAVGEHGTGVTAYSTEGKGKKVVSSNYSALGVLAGQTPEGAAAFDAKMAALAVGGTKQSLVTTRPGSEAERLGHGVQGPKKPHDARITDEQVAMAMGANRDISRRQDRDALKASKPVTSPAHAGRTALLEAYYRTEDNDAVAAPASRPDLPAPSMTGPKEEEPVLVDADQAEADIYGEIEGS